METYEHGMKQHWMDTVSIDTQDAIDFFIGLILGDQTLSARIGGYLPADSRPNSSREDHGASESCHIARNTLNKRQY